MIIVELAELKGKFNGFENAEFSTRDVEQSITLAVTNNPSFL